MTKNEGGRVTIKDILWKLKENAGRMKSLHEETYEWRSCIIKKMVNTNE